MTNNTNHQQITTGLLNPSKDSVFHQLFTNPNPQSEKALKCFLEAILQEQISNIEIQREELQIEDSSLNKNSMYDVNCKINEKEFARIKIHNSDSKEYFANQVTYYCARLLKYHTENKNKYNDIPKVYQISILNFIYNNSSPKELFHYKLSTEDGLTINEQQNIIVIELPKICKLVEELQNKTKTIQNLTTIQKWCIFILYASTSELDSIIQEIAQSDQGIMSAFTALKEISHNKKSSDR